MPLPPRRRRARPGLITAAALAAAAVITVVVFYRPASGQAPGQPPPRPTDAGRVPARAPDSPAPGTVSTAGWHAVALDGTVVPASGQAVPRQGPWPLAAGFADTPAGAVLAAVNIAVRTSGQLGPAIFKATITRTGHRPGRGRAARRRGKTTPPAVGQHPPADPGGPAGPPMPHPARSGCCPGPRRRDGRGPSRRGQAGGLSSNCRSGGRAATGGWSRRPE